MASSPPPCETERRASLRCSEAASISGADCAPLYNVYKQCMRDAAQARAATRASGLSALWPWGGDKAAAAAAAADAATTKQ
jgi:hypothetical protein